MGSDCREWISLDGYLPVQSIGLLHAVQSIG
jgi:hypothetical protein